MSAVQTTFAEVFSSALRGEPCQVIGIGGVAGSLPVSSWRQSADSCDVAMLACCVGATLDIGCGPGRMTQHLAERGHLALGIDVVPEAVFQARERGAMAMLRDVFDPVPGEGRWTSALLADGNIGIGGDPKALLVRVRELLAPGGTVVVDLGAPGTGIETRTIRLQAGSRTCKPFRWAYVGADAIGLLAAGAGLVVEELRHCGDRWFAVLRKEP